MKLQEGVHLVTEHERAILVDVWEAAVRATHHFLSESDIQFFKPLVPKGGSAFGVRLLDRLVAKHYEAK